MNDLVFLKPNTKEPFTTSDIIAQFTGNSYRSVQRIIEVQMKRLETFGQVRFEITPVKYKRGTNFKKVYHLNEQQATLLITFLKNTDIVADFKVELVRQFYAMREELFRVRTAKMERKPLRLDMTDAIKALPDSPHKTMKYKHYTDLAYKTAFGKSAKQLRKERGAPEKAVASDYMTAEEIEAAAKMENRIAVLIDLGMDYQKIKATLLNRCIQVKSA